MCTFSLGKIESTVWTVRIEELAVIANELSRRDALAEIAAYFKAWSGKRNAPQVLGSGDLQSSSLVCFLNLALGFVGGFCWKAILGRAIFTFLYEAASINEIFESILECSFEDGLQLLNNVSQTSSVGLKFHCVLDCR